MTKRDIDTPALILDLDVVEENIRTMGEYFAARPQKLRPHFKTPKTAEIARRQLAAGAIGITASKLGEVEVLARAGLGPVLLANQIAGPAKIDRFFKAAARISLIGTIESEFNVREFEAGAARAGRAADVIIEVDTGMHRCGTETPEETVELVRLAKRAGLNYRGVMGYEGHAVLLPDSEKRIATAREALTTLSRHVEALRSAGARAGNRERGRDRHVRHRGHLARRNRSPGGVVRVHGRRISQGAAGSRSSGADAARDGDFAARRAGNNRRGNEIAHQRIWSADGQRDRRSR